MATQSAKIQIKALPELAAKRKRRNESKIGNWMENIYVHPFYSVHLGAYSESKTRLSIRCWHLATRRDLCSSLYLSTAKQAQNTKLRHYLELDIMSRWNIITARAQFYENH